LSELTVLMAISAYQINNVLRVYGEQLRQSMIYDNPEVVDTDAPEKISISAKTIRNTIIDDIASNIIKRITQSGPHDRVEKEALKKPENEHGQFGTVNDDLHNKLIFKEINGHGETINSLSIEDSKFLTNKLKEITKETEKNNIDT
jgi:hypothetical protein